MMTKNLTNVPVHKILAALPNCIPQPEIRITEDNCVELEWYIKPRHLLSLDVDQSGHIDFAGMQGDDRYHGSGQFEELQEEIIRRLEKLYGRTEIRG